MAPPAPDLWPATPLVGAEALAGRLGDPGVVVADVRWYLDGRSGREAYERGHVPGAVFVDLDTVLAGPPEAGPGRHPLPDPGAFAGHLGRLGVADDAAVVAYDDAGGSVAARLWWMLRAVGQRAAVLDGGLPAWTGPLESGPPPARAAVARTPRPWPPVADADAAGQAGADPAAVLLDARAPERYRGETEPVDPRAGHIPGALSAPWTANLDPATGRFLAPGELRRRFAALGAGDGDDVVVYCGSGVTSCHLLLALEVAGVPGGRLYAGSWSDWCHDPLRPVATGPSPGGAVPAGD